VPPGLPSHAEAVAAAKAQKAPTAAAASQKQQQLRSPQRAATPNGPSSAAAAARASSSSSSSSAARDYFAGADAAQYAQEVGGGAEGEAQFDDELRQLRLRLRTAKRQGAPLAKRRQEVRCARCCLLLRLCWL
jgi:hypothetical protein